MNDRPSYENLRERAAAPSADRSVALPWQSILRWNLLILLWGIPLYALGLVVHELGHELAAVLVGLHAYGISFPFLVPVIESGETCFQNLVIDIGGVGLASLSAALVLPFCLGLRPSLVRLGFVLYCAGAAIHSALYITSGYYCQFGDFGGWKADFPHMRFLMPLLVAGLPAIGYMLGGIYLPVQEPWLPADTPAQRRKVSVLAPGFICVVFSLAAGWARQTHFHPALPGPYTFLIVFAFAMLLFAGGVPRLYDKRLFPARVGQRWLPCKAFLLPLPFYVLLGLASQMDVIFPHRPAGMWVGGRYTDALVARDEDRFSLCNDEQGNVLWLTRKDPLVRTLSPDGRKTQLDIPGLTPLRIKAHHQLIYLLGKGPQGLSLATYDARHKQLSFLLDDLEEAGAFDAAPNGDICFAKQDNQVWFLPAGTKQARLMWLAPQSVTDIASGPSGRLYISLADNGFSERGRIYAVGPERHRPRLVAQDLSNPRALALDGQDNLYVAGVGWSSLCVIPVTNRTERLVVRGYGIKLGVALGSGDSIFYWPITSPGESHDLRVLRPKRTQGARPF